MAAICRSYASHGEALEAVKAAMAAGIDGGDVLVMTGRPAHDVREEPVGGFAGTAPHDVEVGSYSGASHAHDEDQGAFAGGAQRGGSFADAEREVVATYPGGVERMHVEGHRRVLRLLTDAGLDEATATRDLEALHAGRVLLLIDVAEGDVDRVGGLLDA